MDIKIESVKRETISCKNSGNILLGHLNLHLESLSSGYQIQLNQEGAKSIKYKCIQWFQVYMQLL